MEKTLIQVGNWQHFLAETEKMLHEPLDLNGLMGLIVEKFEPITRSSIEIGDFFERILRNNPSPDSKEATLAYLANYYLPEIQKELMILLRDCHFSMQKAQIFWRESLVSEEKLEKLVESCAQTMRKALADAGSSLELRENEIEKLGKAGKKELNKLRLQKNPWPSYREQLLQLHKQVQELDANTTRLAKVGELLREIGVQTHQMLAGCEEEMEKLDRVLEAALVWLASAQQGNDFKAFQAQLEALLDRLQLEPLMQIFDHSTDQNVLFLPGKTSFAISHRGGYLVEKEVNFQMRVSAWMKSELFPQLYECWELTEGIHNQVKMSLANLQTSKTGENVERAEQTWQDWRRKIEQLVAAIHLAKTDLGRHSATVSQRLEKQFKVSAAFNPHGYFLSVASESPYQMEYRNDRLLNRLLRWSKEVVGQVKRRIKLAEQEEALSLGEKIARYLNAKSTQSETQAYCSIFLTKGFVSASFTVGRKEEMRRVEEVLENWKRGSRGSVLIAGQRLSGKSLFGEMLADRFFAEDVLKLQAGQALDFLGHRLEASNDLGKALAFAAAHAPNQRYLIWIDDLETWWDEQHPMNANFRKLCSFLNQPELPFFVVVSVGNAAMSVLNMRSALEQNFQAIVCMDEMPLEEIQEAIRIRHRATHKRLVHPSGEALKPNELGKFIKLIYKLSQGNIGEALAIWSAFVSYVSEQDITLQAKGRLGLPDFLEHNSGILLAAMMQHKGLHESKLTALFGPEFEQMFGHSLHRLLALGLVSRQEDGFLEPNSLVVHSLGLLLEEKHLIEYHAPW